MVSMLSGLIGFLLSVMVGIHTPRQGALTGMEGTTLKQRIELRARNRSIQWAYNDARANSVWGPLHALRQAATMMTGGFPAFERAVFPVGEIPNWGAMHSAAEWNRGYAQLSGDDLIPVPAYDLKKLAMPFKTLVSKNDEQEITRKLFYSTKFLGKYDLDAAEYSGLHPGIDLKLALGTPIGSVAGGRVHAVNTGGNDHLGNYVVIEHRHPAAGTFFSVYGHLGDITVRAGQDVLPGSVIGVVGSTGSSTGPHLHLQIDRGRGGFMHAVYAPEKGTTAEEAERWTVHPIRFVETY